MSTRSNRSEHPKISAGLVHAWPLSVSAVCIASKVAKKIILNPTLKMFLRGIR